jgi:hypothetical protein
MPVILVLRRRKQEDNEFKASLGYKVRACLKKNKTKKTSKQNSKQMKKENGEL